MALLHSNPDQPRIETKAANIGPGDEMRIAIVVRPEGNEFEIIDGHERWTWLRQSGKTTALCDILEVDHQEGSFLGFRLNSARESYSEIEQGRFFALKSREGFTQEQIAKRCNVSQQTVSRCLELVGFVSSYGSTVRSTKGLTNNKLKHISRLPVEKRKETAKIVEERNVSTKDTPVVVAKVHGGLEPAEAVRQVEEFKESHKQEQHQDRRRDEGRNAAPHRNYEGYCRDCGARPYFIHLESGLHEFHEEAE